VEAETSEVVTSNVVFTNMKREVVAPESLKFSYQYGGQRVCMHRHRILNKD